MKVYEAIAKAVRAEDFGPVFGLMGDGNMWWWGIYLRDGGTIYSSWHEQAAVSMADGHFRTTGKVGVATVTGGPGLSQCGTSLTQAVRNRSALVLLIGENPKGAKNQLQTFEQKAFTESCGARYVSISSVDNLAEEMAEAFYSARVHRRPVVVSIAHDLQDMSFDWEFDYRPSTDFITKRTELPAEEELAPVVAALAAAERPVIVAGRGARYAGAKEEILALAERIGALVATSLPNKDWFAGAPYDIGISGSFASAPSEQLLADADFVLGVGAELGYYTTEGGLLFPSANVARIDIRPAPESIGIIPGLYIRGDAKRTIAALNEALEKQQVRKTGFRTPETQKIMDTMPEKWPVPTDGLDPRVIAQHLTKALPAKALITCGAGHFQCFPVMYTSLPKGAELHFSYQFGAVGQGLPLAIGLGIGNPGRPHVAMEGDGSVMMNLQELQTVTRYGLQMVLIIWNDTGYGAEVLKLRKKGFDETKAQWESPDFVSIARAMGGDGVVLKSEAEIVDAVKTGLAKGGLYLIDARISPTSVADPYRKVHLGLPNLAPLLRHAVN
jgi:thiamine pyrophosphate-dependent acetolactate synthase large subunit-like protein